MNGQALCQTPCVLNAVLPGIHYLKISIPGYRVFKQKLMVQGGTMLPIQASLALDPVLEKKYTYSHKVLLNSKEEVESELIRLGQENHLSYILRLRENHTEIFQLATQSWQPDLEGLLLGQESALLQRLTPRQEPMAKVSAVQPWYGHWVIPLGIGLGLIGAGAGTYYLLQEPKDVIHGDMHF